MLIFSPEWEDIDIICQKICFLNVIILIVKFFYFISIEYSTKDVEKSAFSIFTVVVVLRYAGYYGHTIDFPETFAGEI
jgi:hypothetical protein